MLASSFYMLILTRIVLGLGEGLGMLANHFTISLLPYLVTIIMSRFLGLPTIYHMFAEDVPAEQRSRAFGYLAAFGSIGQVVAAAVSRQ